MKPPSFSNTMKVKSAWVSLYLLASLFLLASAGCVDRKAQAETKSTEKFLADKVTPVKVAPTADETVIKTVPVTGNLTTSMITQVGARQPGRIIEVLVKDGDSVTAGQVIAREDASQMRASLEQALAQEQAASSALTQAISNEMYQPIKAESAVSQARSQVVSAEQSLKKELAGVRTEAKNQAKANLAAAKTNLQVAQSNLKRQETLFDQGAIPQDQLDTARNQEAAAQQQYDNALQTVIEYKRGNRPEDIAVARQAVVQAQQGLRSALAAQKLDVLLGEQVQSARAQLAASKAAVSLAQANLNDMTIRAPFSGQVSGQPIQVGTVVAVGTSILKLVSSENTYFDSQVPEQYIASVKVGTPVSVTVDALPGKTYTGVVKAINPLGVEYGRLFTVRVSIEGVTSELRPNMFATGRIQIAKYPHSAVAPADAVLSDNGQQYVFTVQNGVAKRLNITTGVTSANGVQLIGVAPGTLIVVQGQQGLQPGDRVKEISV